MTRIDAGRLVMTCDKCPVRLDLGAEAAARAKNRTPSGWIALGGDRHYCPLCSQTVSLGMLARAVSGTRRMDDAPRVRPRLSWGK